MKGEMIQATISDLVMDFLALSELREGSWYEKSGEGHAHQVKNNNQELLSGIHGASANQEP